MDEDCDCHVVDMAEGFMPKPEPLPEPPAAAAVPTPSDHPSPGAPSGRQVAYAPPCRYRGPFLRRAKTKCPATPLATVFRCDHPRLKRQDVVLLPHRRCVIPSCKACPLRELPE